MGSIDRIRSGKYTEADALALYMQYRESGIGPFIREVGDFLAHSKRDRGATLDTTAYIFAQTAFFQTYQANGKKPLLPRGKCGWWLRHYLLTKAKTTSEREIEQATGLTRKQAKNAIESWFPDQHTYPSEIKCEQPQLLYQLASLFSKIIEGRPVFESSQARAELRSIFKAESIDATEIDRFLIATSILLNGRSVDIVPGFSANLHLRVQSPRYIPVEKPHADDGMQYVRTLPDGALQITVITENTTGDGLVAVALDLLDTEIDTEIHFDRSLVELDKHGFPRLQLASNLSFDSSREKPVH